MSTQEKNRVRAKQWYRDRKNDPEFLKKRNEAVKERYRKRKALAVERFGNKCADCKRSFPDYCYDFHHLDPNVKEADPSVAFRSKKWEEELEKCVLLCACCHRIRHEEGLCEL